jgi:hypothetical protein
MDRSEQLTRAMASIGLAVATGAALSPRALVRAYRIPAREMTGAGAFGWRMFAVRTGYLAVQAIRGDASARAAFLPIQVLDQLVFAHAFRTRSIPRPAAVAAMLTSGAIVALDLQRRSAQPPASTTS